MSRAPTCFELSWPWRLDAGFFKKPEKVIYSEADRCVSLFTIGTHVVSFFYFILIFFNFFSVMLV